MAILLALFPVIVTLSPSFVVLVPAALSVFVLVLVLLSSLSVFLLVLAPLLLVSPETSRPSKSHFLHSQL